MSLVSFLFLFIVVYLIGEILGLAVRCDNVKYLLPVKKYVWIVPFLQIFFFFFFVFQGIKQRSIKLPFLFIICEETNIIILGSLRNLLETNKAKKQKERRVSWQNMKHTADTVRIAIEATT